MKKTPSSRKSLISIYSILGVVANLSLSGSGRKVWWGGRLFEAGRLLPFSAFRMGAYSRWALIRINTVVVQMLFRESARRLLYCNTDFQGKTHSHATRSPALVKLDWTTQKHVYCLFVSFSSLKPIRDSLVPGFTRALPSLAVMCRRVLGSRLY